MRSTKQGRALWVISSLAERPSEPFHYTLLSGCFIGEKGPREGSRTHAEMKCWTCEVPGDVFLLIFATAVQRRWLCLPLGTGGVGSRRAFEVQRMNILNGSSRERRERERDTEERAEVRARPRVARK